MWSVVRLSRLGENLRWKNSFESRLKASDWKYHINGQDYGKT